jgi:hypothetical protein
MVLTQEDLKLLKQLKAAGERGRTIHYRITQRGQDAVAEHAG